METTNLNIRLPDELIRVLSSYCSDIGCSKSWLVQKAIEAYFEDMKKIEICFSPNFNRTDRNFLIDNIKNKISNLV